MFKQFYFVILLFFGTIYFTNCLPLPSQRDRLRKAFIHGVNGIDQKDDISKNNTSSEEVAGILLLDETESNPWDTFLSLRNAFPPSSDASRNRRRFSHFYKKKPNDSISNIDPIVFPTISDESPTIIYAEEAVTQASSISDLSSEDSSSSQSSSTETEAISETENSKIALDIFSTWLWENMTPSTLSQSTVKPVTDIGTHSLYHGPKINKRKLGKIVCPPGQRPNHFGECKQPITLKQNDY